MKTLNVLENPFDATKYSKIPNNCLHIIMSKQCTCKMYHFSKLYLPLAGARYLAKIRRQEWKT